jgi:hypothetical protein
MDITPNLDRRAHRGIRYERAFTPQPVCGRARAFLQTSKNALEVGVYTNGRTLPQDEKATADAPFAPSAGSTAFALQKARDRTPTVQPMSRFFGMILRTTPTSNTT